MDLCVGMRHFIQLRQPQSTTLITGSDREAIDPVYDEDKRLIHLLICTRQGSLRRGKSFQISSCKLQGSVRRSYGKDMETWRLWLAIVLLVDAGIGLLGLSRFEKVIPAPILTRIALIEAALAIAIVLWHFART